MKRITAGLFVALLCLSGLGCTATKEYDVIVTNALPDPIIVFLTKNQEPYEANFEPPEIEAMHGQSRNGVHLAPGAAVRAQDPQTGLPPVKMSVQSGQGAVLRVYRTNDPLRVLAISPGSIDRLDISLDPGKTDIDIVPDGIGIMAVPHANVRRTMQPVSIDWTGY